MRPSYERPNHGRRCLRRSTFFFMIAAVELLAKLGRFNQDAATTMAVVLLTVIVFAYWILRT